VGEAGGYLGSRGIGQRVLARVNLVLPGSDFLTGWANCGSPCMGLFLTSIFNIKYFIKSVQNKKILICFLFFELIFV
jgi:hypothetical protein